MAERSPSTRSLLDLPAEVVQLIAQHLNKAWHINALCLTHPSLYHLLNTSLYRHSIKHDGSFVLIYAAMTGNLPAAKRALDLVSPAGGPAADVEKLIRVDHRRYRAAALSYHPKGTAALCCARLGGWPSATVERAQGMTWRYYTPLGCAIAHKHVDMVRLLLERGARVAETLVEQIPPLPRAPPVLHIAALLGHVEMVSALLRRLRTEKDPVGVREVLSLNYSGRENDGVDACPVYLALREGHVDVVEMLLRAMREHLGPENTAEVVRKLVPAGYKPWVRRDYNELLAGLLAAEMDVFERLVCLLEEFGGKGSLRDATAAAARAGDLDKLQLLLDRGRENADMLELLHAAVANGHVETARYLLQLGADPTARAPPSLSDIELGMTGNGFTALHAALTGPEASLADMIKLLFAHRLQRNESSCTADASFTDGRTLSPSGLTPVMVLILQAKHTEDIHYSPSHPKPRSRRKKTRTKATPGCATALGILLSHGADITLRSLPTAASPSRSVLYLAAVQRCHFCLRAVLHALGYERTIASIREQWHPPSSWLRGCLPGECVTDLDGVLVATPPPGDNVACWRYLLGTAFWDEFGQRVEEVELRRRVVDQLRSAWEERCNELRKEEKGVSDEENGRARRRARRQERVVARKQGEKQTR